MCNSYSKTCNAKTNNVIVTFLLENESIFRVTIKNCEKMVTWYLVKIMMSIGMPAV